MPDKIIGGQFADKPGNYGKADQKGEERDKAKPLQNWFQHVPLQITHVVFELMRRDEGAGSSRHRMFMFQLVGAGEESAVVLPLACVKAFRLINA